MAEVEEIAPCSAQEFEERYRDSYRPLVIRGLAGDWPLVEAGRREPDAALAMVERSDTGVPADIMVAPPEEGGRFFYGKDMQGFNFRRDKATLGQLARHLRQIEAEDRPIGIYAGAADMAAHVPGLVADNPLPLTDGMGAVPRIWMGNATQVATHFDLSDNFAVVATGRRRFTLFPPEATPHLYVGPLNITLAGQPVSMVDPLAPDAERFPDFAKVADSALYADLEPGDAIYVPTLWWHHVAASAPVNLLVNYWHNDARRGGGFLALIHAMLAIREQPPAQRKAWRVWFDHFVFDDAAPSAADHIPAHARGVNGPATPERDEQMRRFILQVLSSP